MRVIQSRPQAPARSRSQTNTEVPQGHRYASNSSEFQSIIGVE